MVSGYTESAARFQRARRFATVGPGIDVAYSPPRKALIMNPVRILLATALAAGTAVLSAGGASAAAPEPGPAFGQHVSQCAKTMGFSGTHNPGVMHQGKSGWDGVTMTSPMP